MIESRTEALPAASGGSVSSGGRGWAALRARLLSPTDAAALGVFRIVFGLLGFVSAVRALAYGFVDEMFVKPRVLLSYWGFSFLPQPSAVAVKVLFVSLALLSLLVAAGLFYRVAIVLYALLFTYLELLDVSNYLNHYYLVTWLALLACVVPLHRTFSLDAHRHGWAPELPLWCTWLFRFQVGLVYLFAGLAKLSADWLLHAQPLQIWLASRTDLPVVGPYLGQIWVAFLAAWIGFLFDTSIAFFLLAERTRPAAYVALVGFHLATWALFPIGMFPFIMMTGALVFFSPSWPRRWANAWRRRVGAREETPPSVSSPEPRARSSHGRFHGGVALFAAYAIFQLGMPLRTHAYGGDVQWHEQGMRFSWRVMVREKNGSLTYRLHDLDSDKRWEVSPRAFLLDRQAREMATQPDLILQLAHRIAADAASKGHPRVAVFADTRVSWNGRPGAPLIDPSVDLASVQDGLGKAWWVLPSPSTAPARLTPLARRLPRCPLFPPTGAGPAARSPPSRSPSVSFSCRGPPKGKPLPRRAAWRIRPRSRRSRRRPRRRRRCS